MSSVQGSSPFISAGTLCIHELFERNSRRPISTIAGRGTRHALAQAIEVGDDWLWRQLDLARRRAQDLRDARLQRPQVQPIGIVLDSCERQSAWLRAEGVAIGAGA